jgi:dethiobiotin synthase
VRGIIVAGIGTDVGKTVASAVLCEVLGADYWKPVASGIEAGATDSDVVASLIVDGARRVHSPGCAFKKPLSPHIAAALEGRSVSVDSLTLPDCEQPIVVELAGGVLVPLNDEHTNMELVSRFALPVVVVSRHYLGSINHTLLTLEALRARGAAVMGVVFNGEELPDTERIIERLGQVRVLGRIPTISELSPQAIREAAKGVRLPL